MSEMVGIPERVRSWRRVSTSFSLPSIGARAERRAPPVFPFFGGKGGDEQAVFQ